VIRPNAPPSDHKRTAISAARVRLQASVVGVGPTVTDGEDRRTGPETVRNREKKKKTRFAPAGTRRADDDNSRLNTTGVWRTRKCAYSRAARRSGPPDRPTFAWSCRRFILPRRVPDTHVLKNGSNSKHARGVLEMLGRQTRLTRDRSVSNPSDRFHAQSK